MNDLYYFTIPLLSAFVLTEQRGAGDKNLNLNTLSHNDQESHA